MLVGEGSKTKEKMDSFVRYVADNEDGLGQAGDLEIALVATNRLLTETHLTPAEMLKRVMRAPANFCRDLFVLTADFYETRGGEPWAEFGRAAIKIPMRHIILRAMGDIAPTIVRRALGKDDNGGAVGMN